MEMHFATVWESIADAIPEAPATTHADITRTWAEWDDRSARVAAALVAAGLQPQSKAALYLYNGNEYLEAQFGIFKMRGVSVNVNYRYLDEELWYLLDNSDAEALFFHSSLGDRVARVAERLPLVKLWVEVDDGGPTGQVPGSVAFEDLVSGNDPMERITRSEDDIYMLYTGGTTGMPKGVMYDMGGLAGGFIRGGPPLVGLEPAADAAGVAALAKQAIDSGTQMVSIPCAPLMHGTGMWIGGFIPQGVGAHVVTLTSRSLDAHEILATVEKHKATAVTIVGDSFAKPIIEALDEGKPDGSKYDTSTLGLMASSGVMWTAEVKDQIIDRIPQVVLLDAMGSSEGSMGTSITMKGVPAKTAKFTQMEETKVFTPDDKPVEPGSDEIGYVATALTVPIGYYKDEEKSARTFRTIDGVRYSFPGDMAQVAEDGTLILLGRGSQVINSGGEKIYPEEVEEAVKRVDGVVDCLVVGIDDEKFGQAVTAVASLAEGAVVSEEQIIDSVKSDIARYKAPKSVVFVDTIPRAPNGKADYKTARDLAEA